jgi:hypothetical protein
LSAEDASPDTWAEPDQYMGIHSTFFALALYLCLIHIKRNIHQINRRNMSKLVNFRALCTPAIHTLTSPLP